ncbi:MAG: hypothetical protein AB1578_10430 [Thermodesulfobacteriota bacterium]
MARLYSHLFYLLFASPVLSPAVGDTSVYLYLLVPLVDPHFLRELGSRPIERRHALAALLFVAASVPYGSVLFLFKVVSVVVCAAYMAYTARQGFFYLYGYVALNVGVALVQAVGVLGFGAELLFPAAIGEFLYGAYALPTGPPPTGAEGLLMAFRFSGLSREPGFFAALLIGSFVLLVDDRSVPRRRTLLAAHALGLVLSFSKVSVSFFLVFPFAWLLRRAVDRVPKWAVVGGVLGGMMVVTQAMYGVHGADFINQSFLHRTIGYAVVPELPARDLWLGVGFRNAASRAAEVPLLRQGLWFEDRPGVVVAGSGLSSVVIDHGLLYFALLVFLLYLLRVRSYPLLLFLVMTINENPLTSQSFVLLGIYYLLRDSERRSREAPSATAPG